MPQENNQQDNQATKSKDYQELIRQVAQKVWEMWREDLRHERERRGGMNRS